jgi:hypothetical protein
MAWHNLVSPLPFVALWYCYLEQSKQVRTTYPIGINAFAPFPS